MSNHTNELQFDFVLGLRDYSRLNTNPKRQRGRELSRPRWRFGLVFHSRSTNAPGSFRIAYPWYRHAIRGPVQVRMTARFHLRRAVVIDGSALELPDVAVYY